MIYVRLAGGLGNQLYQLLAATLLSQRSGGVAVVPLVDALSSYTKRNLPQSLQLIRSPVLREPYDRATPTFMQWLSLTARAGRWLSALSLNDGNFERLMRGDIRRGGICFVDGYFQNAWNQRSFEEAVGTIETLPPPGERVNVDRYDCLIHIRGGDFLNYPTHCFVDERYYAHAVDLAARDGIVQFGVVSDDHAHARALLDAIGRRRGQFSYDFVPATGGSLADFDMLTRAKARIIGNSTFAWWAAAFDTRRAVTWSPREFVKGKKRDFTLQWERVLDDWQQSEPSHGR